MESASCCLLNLENVVFVSWGGFILSILRPQAVAYSAYTYTLTWQCLRVQFGFTGLLLGMRKLSVAAVLAS